MGEDPQATDGAENPRDARRAEDVMVSWYPWEVKHMISRRSFLKVTAGAAAMAALGPHGYCAAAKRNLRKAIMYSTIGVKGSVLEKFRAMKEAGFEGVEPMGGMNREEVIAAFKETGLEAASVCCHTHWEKPLSAPDEATRKIGWTGC
jgi:hexulose-6-phosphate isomerase